MFCPNCNNVVGEGVDICSNCGTKLNMIQQPEQQIYTQSQNNDYQQSNNNKRNKLIVTIIAIIVVALLGFILYKFLVKDNSKNNNLNHELYIDMMENDIHTSITNSDANSKLQILYDKEGDFIFEVEDVFKWPGRGTNICGRVNRGKVNKNDRIQIIGLDQEIITTSATSIEKNNNPGEFEEVSYAEAGEYVCIMLTDVPETKVQRGHVLVKPDSINAHKKFEAKVDMYIPEVGGRETSFSNDYQPQFYFRTADATGTITLPPGVENVNPGDKNITMTIELEHSFAMEIGTLFNVRENGKIVGRGIVTKVY